VTGPHYYAWRSVRRDLYRRRCQILAAGRRYALVEFDDNGQREVLLRRSLKRITP